MELDKGCSSYHKITSSRNSTSVFCVQPDQEGGFGNDPNFNIFAQFCIILSFILVPRYTAGEGKQLPH